MTSLKPFVVMRAILGMSRPYWPRRVLVPIVVAWTISSNLLIPDFLMASITPFSGFPGVVDTFNAAIILFPEVIRRSVNVPPISTDIVTLPDAVAIDVHLKAQWVIKSRYRC